jgi:hypothetical protein
MNPGTPPYPGSFIVVTYIAPSESSRSHWHSLGDSDGGFSRETRRGLSMIIMRRRCQQFGKFNMNCVGNLRVAALVDLLGSLQEDSWAVQAAK